MAEPITTSVIPETKPPESKDLISREELNKVIAERDAAKAKYRQIEPEFNQYREFFEKAQMAEKEKAEKERLDKLSTEERYKAIIKSNEDKSKAEKDTIIKKIASKLIPERIKAICASIPNLSPDAIEDLPNLLGDKLALDDTGFDVIVVDEAGRPVLNDKAERQDLKEYITNFVNNKPYMLLNKMPAKTGAVNANNKTPGNTTSSKLDIIRDRLKRHESLDDLALQYPDEFAQAVKEMNSASNIDEMTSQATSHLRHGK